MFLASGARDASVCIWDLQRRACTARIKGHRAAVTGLAWMDSATIVSSSLDSSLRVRDVSAGGSGGSGAGRAVRTLTEHDQAVTGVVRLSSDVVASCASDSSVRLWDLRADRPCVATCFEHEAAVYAIANMSAAAAAESLTATAAAVQDCTLVSASWDRTIVVWNMRMLPPSGSSSSGGDISRGRCVRTLRGHTDAVRALVAIDEHTLASAGWDRSIRLWDLSSPSSSSTAAANSSSGGDDSDDDCCIGMLPTVHDGWVYSLAYLASEGLVVSASGDRTLKLSSPETLSTTSVLTGHENTIWTCAALPALMRMDDASPVRGAGCFVSGGADAQIRLWDTLGKSCTRLSASSSSSAGAAVEPSPVYALDVWPPANTSAAPRKKLKLPKRGAHAITSGNSDSNTRSHESANQQHNVDSALQAAVPNLLGIYTDSTELHHAAAASSAVASSSAGAESSWFSHVEYERFSKPAAGLASSVLGHTTISSSSFSVANSGFHPVATKPQPPATATAAPFSVAVAALPLASTDASLAAASSPASSPSSAAADLFSQLAALRSSALAFFAASSYIEAEKVLLEMVELLEAEREGHSSSSSSSSSPGPPSPTESPRTRISAATVSRMLFVLFHDLSLLALLQGAHAASLRYATRCLAFYEPDDEADDEASEHLMVADRNFLLQQQQRLAATLDDIITANASLAIQSLRELDSDSASPSSSPTVAAPASSPSLLLILTLHRFWCAYMTRDLELSMRLSLEILSSVSPLTDGGHAREILDELALADGDLPSQSIYGHVLRLHHRELLVAHAARQMESILAHKDRGNAFFSGTDAAASSSSSPSPAGPQYGSAAAEYARGIRAALALEDLLDDLQRCPSIQCFERCAAQIPSSTSTSASSSAQLPPGAWMIHDGAGGASSVGPAPFSRHTLSFLVATLCSNYAQACLKCSDADFATMAGPCRFARPRRATKLGATKQRAAGGLDDGLADPALARVVAAQEACEAGIESMETLSRVLGPLRERVAKAQKQVSTIKPSGSAANHGEDRCIYTENLILGCSLPSLSACSGLASKLYYRHGLAVLARADSTPSDSDHHHTGLDDLAQASFQLSLHMQPDSKVRVDIERRKKQREVQQQQQQQQQPQSTTASP